MGKSDININKVNTYTVDGKEYASFDDLPDYAKDLLKDDDENGVPDILEGVSQQPNTHQSTSTSTIIEVNGKKYNSWVEVPEAYRKMMNFPQSPESGTVVREETVPEQNSFGRLDDNSSEANNLKSIVIKAALAVGFGVLLYFLLS